MRITVDYKKQASGLENLKIDSANYLSDYTIKVWFNNGTERRIDFKPFLSKSLHPSIKKYLDKNKFSNFTLLNGNLN